ncbi:MAG: N-acetylmuramoyl-L-alanine amidase-like domain-containing protein, partial [Trichodesmium sp.]
MRKLLELLILGIAFTGSYTGNLSIFLDSGISFTNTMKLLQNHNKIQRKFILNHQDNDQENLAQRKLINSESSSKFPIIQLADTNLKFRYLSRQSILKEAPVGPSQPPTRPLIDINLNKSGRDKRINKKAPNNIQEDPKFQPVMEYAIKQNLAEGSMAEIMQAIADYFIGTPYKAGLLDQSNQESLVITLDGFDCVLFVETVLAMA